MPKRIRVHTEVHHPGSGSDYQDLPEEWDDWDRVFRQSYLDALAEEYRRATATTTASVVEVDARGREVAS